MSGEKKTANEQMLLLAQMAWKNLCITCHVSLFKNTFFQRISNYQCVAITVNMQTDRSTVITGPLCHKSSSFVWASSFIHCLATLNFGAGFEQPFGCLIIQNRQAVQRSIDWTLENNMVDGLFFCATLTGHRGGHTPFVQAGAETSNTSAGAVEPDPGSSWESHSGGCVPAMFFSRLSWWCYRVSNHFPIYVWYTELIFTKNASVRPNMLSYLNTILTFGKQTKDNFINRKFQCRATYSFTHFRARFSFGESCRGSSRRRPRNASQSAAISDSSADSTPRRDQARLET